MLVLCSRLVTVVAAALGVAGVVLAADPLRSLQDQYVATKDQKQSRVYHFGSQGPRDVFSNHTTHSNRLLPVYVFGKAADLGAITGKNSPYRDPEAVRRMYGRLPEHTVNPAAEYGDQSGLYQVQKAAIDRGAKYVFTVWFDGLDWETTRAAALARTGKDYTEGKGSGLLFLDETADGTAQFGCVVCSPTRDDPPRELYDVDRQTIGDLSGLPGGGYDARFGGPNPWTAGPLAELREVYLRGQIATRDEVSRLSQAGGVVHAMTDSAPSAGEYATGVKMFNNGINVADDGRLVPTLMNQIQGRGWKVGTVSSVPFPHASPAAMYAHNVSRDDYQDLAREMLGLESIVQQTGRGPRLPGLDVVIGTGHGTTARPGDAEKQGANFAPGTPYLADADLAAIAVENGGKYVVAQRTAGVAGGKGLQAAAEKAAAAGQRLFGYYGTKAGHLPYSSANGDYQPAKNLKGVAEVYSAADLSENPTLADMTRAAITALSARSGQPFALFVEPGDVDWALHDNNLDATIGAIYDGDAAVKVIVDWVRAHSNWEESVLIVTSDHGHLLMLDDPKELAGAAGR